MMNILALGLLLSSLGSVMVLSPEPLLVKSPADSESPLQAAKEATQGTLNAAKEGLARGVEAVTGRGKEERGGWFRKKVQPQPVDHLGAAREEAAAARDAFLEASSNLKHAGFEKLGSTAQSAKEAASNTYHGTGKLASEKASQATGAAGHAAGVVKDAAYDVGDKGKSTTAKACRKTKEGVEDTYESAADTLESAKEMTFDKLDSARKSTYTAAENLRDNTHDKVDATKEKAGDAKDWTVDTAADTRDFVVDNVHLGVDKSKGTAVDAAEQVKETGELAALGAKDAGLGLIEKVKEVACKTAECLRLRAQEAGSFLPNVGQGIGYAYDTKAAVGDSVGQGVSNAAQSVKETADNVAEDVSELGENAKARTKEGAQGAINSAKNSYESVRDRTGEQYRGAKDRAGANYDGAKEYFDEAGRRYRSARDYYDASRGFYNDGGPRGRVSRHHYRGARDIPYRYYETAKDEAEDYYEDVRDRTRNAYGGVKDRAGDYYDDMRDKFSRTYPDRYMDGRYYQGARGKAGRYYQGARDRASDSYDNARRKVGDAYYGAQHSADDYYSKVTNGRAGDDLGSVAESMGWRRIGVVPQHASVKPSPEEIVIGNVKYAWQGKSEPQQEGVFNRVSNSVKEAAHSVGEKLGLAKDHVKDTAEDLQEGGGVAKEEMVERLRKAKENGWSPRGYGQGKWRESPGYARDGLQRRDWRGRSWLDDKEDEDYEEDFDDADHAPVGSNVADKLKDGIWNAGQEYEAQRSKAGEYADSARRELQGTAGFGDDNVAEYGKDNITTEGGRLRTWKQVFLRRPVGFLLGLTRLLHLFTFSTIYGSSFWVTFVSGLILSKNIPRQQFGYVQSRMFPVYLRILAIGEGLLFLLLSIMHPWFSADNVERWQLNNFVWMIAATLLNVYYLEPRATKVMFERLKVEKEEGRVLDTTSSPAGAKQVSEDHKKKLAAINQQFKVLHSYSSALNLVSLAGLTWHLWHLARRLVI